jgi:hypothetical protein
MLLWITASERFPYSTSLEVKKISGVMNTINFNISDSGKLIATLHVKMDYPQSNPTGVPIHFELKQLANSELDSIKITFDQYGYSDKIPTSIDATSSIPPELLDISTQGEKSVVSSDDLGSHGVGNITLNLTIGLRHSYRVYEISQYDVDIRLWLSMHYRAPIQLTSLEIQRHHMRLYVHE